MNWIKFDNTYLLKLDVHEELTREIKKFCAENKINNASIKAIGAVNSVTLGFYNTQAHTYEEQSFHKSFELSSAIGTFVTKDEEQILHIHAVVTDKDFRAYGGHLFRAICSNTIEVLITELVN